MNCRYRFCMFSPAGEFIRYVATVLSPPPLPLRLLPLLSDGWPRAQHATRAPSPAHADALGHRVHLSSSLLRRFLFIMDLFPDLTHGISATDWLRHQRAQTRPGHLSTCTSITCRSTPPCTSQTNYRYHSFIRHLQPYIDQKSHCIPDRFGSFSLRSLPTLRLRCLSAGLCVRTDVSIRTIDCIHIHCQRSQCYIATLSSDLTFEFIRPLVFHTLEFASFAKLCSALPS